MLKPITISRCSGDAVNAFTSWQVGYAEKVIFESGGFGNEERGEERTTVSLSLFVSELAVNQAVVNRGKPYEN